MSFLARLVSNNFISLEKFEMGALSPQPPLRKNISAWGLLVHSYLRVRFDLSISIKFRDICDFPKLGAHDSY